MSISLVQSGTAQAATGAVTVNLAAVPTAGNLLVAAVTMRDNNSYATPDGWTVRGTATIYGSSHQTVYTKTAGTAEGTAVAVVGASNASCLVVAEFSGIAALSDTATIGAQANAGAFSVGPVTAADQEVLLFGALASVNANGADDYALVAGTAFTEVQSAYTSGDLPPYAVSAYRVVSPAAGDYSYTATIDWVGATTGAGAGPGGWGGVLLAFSGITYPGAFADWDGLGFGAVDSASDLSGDLISWRVSRGASPEITGGASVGQATLLLRNRDNRYNPENTSGTLYGNLRDGVPLWLGVDANGQLSGTVVHGLFGGRTRDITPIPTPGFTYPPTVEITAEDDLARLARVEVSLADSRTRSHGDLRAAILTAADVTSTTLPPEIDTMPLSGGRGPALALLEDVNRATGTRHFIAPADSAGAQWYTYVARDRQWGLAGTAAASIGTAQHADNVSGWRKSADTVVNAQRVSWSPVTFTPAQVTVWEAGELPFGLLSSAGTVTRWVEFDDFVDSPTVDLAYTGSTVTATLTAFGDTAKLTLSSAGTSTITGLSVEGALARRAPTESYVANNATSQADPRGVRSGPDITSPYVGVLATARGIAEHVVWRYGSPQLRPTLTVHNWLPTQFSLDLFDVISFTSPQLGVTARLFEIVGLTHEGNRASDNSVHHTVTYVLQESRVQTSTVWFTTDTHAPDGTAILGY